VTEYGAPFAGVEFPVETRRIVRWYNAKGECILEMMEGDLPRPEWEKPLQEWGADRRVVGRMEWHPERVEMGIGPLLSEEDK